MSTIIKCTIVFLLAVVAFAPQYSCEGRDHPPPIEQHQKDTAQRADVVKPMFTKQPRVKPLFHSENSPKVILAQASPHSTPMQNPLQIPLDQSGLNPWVLLANGSLAAVLVAVLVYFIKFDKNIIQKQTETQSALSKTVARQEQTLELMQGMLQKSENNQDEQSKDIAQIKGDLIEIKASLKTA